MTRERKQNWPGWMFRLRPWRYMLDYRKIISQEVQEIEDEEYPDFHNAKTDVRATLKLPTVDVKTLEMGHN